mgnify:CR=1 FL=1
METINKRNIKSRGIIGPGVITGASDDDPSGIGTYSQTGAGYGTAFLWLSPATIPLMVLIQEMCARIGLVTGRGLASNIRRHVGRFWLGLAAVLLLSANIFNIGADLSAMAASFKLLFPAVPFYLAISGITLLTIGLEIALPYKTYSRYLKWLTFSLFAYVAAAFAAQIPWRQVFVSLFHPGLPRDGASWTLVAAVLGTTISPYLFFWQTSEEVEEEISEGKMSLKSREGASLEEIRSMRKDIWSGMTASNVIMFFIIATCAFTLHKAGITNIETPEAAAKALEPLAGSWSSFWFSLGILGTGLLAIPVLSGSAAYALAEIFGWREGLSLPYRKAVAFYSTLAGATFLGLLMNIVNLPPMKMLLWAAVGNALAAPVLIVLIVIVSAQEKTMGRWKNKWWISLSGIGLATIMAVSGYMALFN